MLFMAETGISQPNQPAGLLVELLNNPSEAVITDAEPEFGWMVNDSRRGANQSAYQILVATTERALNRDRGNMWDSGKVDSDQSINVEYAGKELQSRQGYYWKVRTWDQSGQVSPYSEPQLFYTSDLAFRDRAWPEESRWVELPDGSGQLVLEDRHPMKYHDVEPV
ncbi:MAG: hypothetical protein GF372_11385, partial [Candidatus Marinimicrobia bacterium]|nr:hypothetical protein [Candidatus Neomarinimicrobiota bacterium]